MPKAGSRGSRRERVCLLLLAAGSFCSGLLTVVGGLGMTMVLSDLMQERGSAPLGWAMVGVYASQIIAVLLGWIAFALNRPRLAGALAAWPIMLGLLLLIGWTLVPR